MNGHEQSERVIEYVTVTIGDQLFGLPISRVQDVFVPGRMTQVPLASDDIAGVINLRGRIVTAIDMRRRLGIAGARRAHGMMAVGIDCNGESVWPGDRFDRRSDEALRATPREGAGQSRQPPRARRRRRAPPGKPVARGARCRPAARYEARRNGRMTRRSLYSACVRRK